MARQRITTETATAAAFLLAIFTSSSAFAATTWQIGGTFTQFVDFVAEFSIGAPFDLSITFDENQVGTPNGSSTTYVGVATFSSGTYFASDPSAEILITSGSPGFIQVALDGPEASLPDYTIVDANGMPTGTRSPVQIRAFFQLLGGVSTTDLLDYIDFGSTGFVGTPLFQLVTSGGAFPTGRVDQVVTVVPEPSSALLIGLGLAGLCATTQSSRRFIAP